MRWVLLWVGLIVAFESVARADTPANLIIVVDPSMAPEKVSVVRTALTTAVADMPAKDKVAVIAAGAKPSTPVALREVGDTKRVVAGLDKLEWAKHADVAAGLRAARSIVAKLPANANGDTRVLVITDAETMPGVEKEVAALAKAGASVSARSYQGGNAATLAKLTSGAGESEIVFVQDALVDAVVDLSSFGPKPIALVLVIDRSGSMEGARLEAAKEAARVVAEVLDPNDLLAVVAFDTNANVIVPPTRASNRMRISTDISRLHSGGGTNIYPGLEEAADILADLRRVTKHVIVLTDGESPNDGVADLVTDMHAAKIQVSAVGLQGADRELLTTIADKGNGRLYMVDDIGQLPKIFMRAAGK